MFFISLGSVLCYFLILMYMAELVCCGTFCQWLICGLCTGINSYNEGHWWSVFWWSVIQGQHLRKLQTSDEQTGEWCSTKAKSRKKNKMEGSRLELLCEPRICYDSYRNLILEQALTQLKENCFDCKAVVITEITSSFVQFLSVMSVTGVECRPSNRPLR